MNDECVISNSPTRDQTNFVCDLREVLDEVFDLLVEKNRKYGDAALNPIRIMSRVDTVEQLRVRMDDKLSRMANRQDDEDEDPEVDLLGYLVLLQIAKKRKM